MVNEVPPQTLFIHSVEMEFRFYFAKMWFKNRIPLLDCHPLKPQCKCVALKDEKCILLKCVRALGHPLVLHTRAKFNLANLETGEAAGQLPSSRPTQ